MEDPTFNKEEAKEKIVTAMKGDQNKPDEKYLRVFTWQEIDAAFKGYRIINKANLYNRLLKGRGIETP